MSNKAPYQRTEPADGPRRILWRAIRDAGVNGLTSSQLADRFEGMASGQRSNVLYLMVRNGYAKKREGKGAAYFIDIDCRVPKGERSHLGPGWDPSGKDGGDDDATERALDAEARRLSEQSTVGLDLQRAWSGTLSAEYSTQPATRVVAAVETAPAPPSRSTAAGLLGWTPAVGNERERPISAFAAAPARSFRSSLCSDGTLALELKSGGVVVLDQEETRALFAWLDRLQGAGLAQSLATETSV